MGGLLKINLGHVGCLFVLTRSKPIHRCFVSVLKADIFRRATHMIVLNLS